MDDGAARFFSLPLVASAAPILVAVPTGRIAEIPVAPTTWSVHLSPSLGISNWYSVSL